jgi:phosphate butyryltransferase
MASGRKIRTLEDLLLSVKHRRQQPTLALASAAQEEGLKSLADAVRHGLVKPALFGDRHQVTHLAKRLKISLKGMELIDEPDPHQATRRAVDLCRQQPSCILMKGSVNTDVVLRAVLNRESGLSTGKLLSHVAVFESPLHKRLMFMTDPAVNITPDVSRKVEIIQNAVFVAKRLGVAHPKVAMLAATEKINVKDMPSTTDAAIIAKMYESGQLTGADAAGPFGLDIAVSKFAAKCKDISGPVAGQADILLCPDINSANILYKALVYFAGAEIASAVLGAKVPIVMTSRSDSSLTKLYTIALSVMLAGDA